MFNNSRYGNLLTIILVIVILAIIAIIGILGYRMYKVHYIETGAMQAATQFETNVNPDNQENKDNNLNGDTLPSGGSSTIEDTFSNNTTGQVTTTYKGFTVVGTIQIPSINLKYPILEKNTKRSLETSVVLMYTSNGMNEVGNTVIIGHNYRNGTMFSNVDKMENGDYIYITDTKGRKVRYKVYNIYRTSGSDSKYITRNILSNHIYDFSHLSLPSNPIVPLPGIHHCKRFYPTQLFLVSFLS